MDAALDEPILTYIESGAAQLLSTAVPDGISDPFSSAEAGWNAGSQEADPYTGTAEARGTVNPFVGQDVDPYTNAPASGANPNAFTGGQDISPFTNFQNTSSAAAIPADSSQILTSNWLIPAGDFATAPSYTSDNTILTGLTPIDTVTIDGDSFAHYQVTIDGVTYDAYQNDTVLHGQIRLDPVPSPALSSVTPSGDSQATQPTPGTVGSPTAAPTAPSTSAPPAFSPGTLDAGSSTPSQNLTAAPTGSLAPGQAGAIPYDPIADSPISRWLLWSSDSPVRDFLTSEANLQSLQHGVLYATAGAELAIATAGSGPAVVAGFGETAEAISATITGLAQWVAATSFRVAATAAGLGTAGEILATHPELEDEATSMIKTAGSLAETEGGGITQPITTTIEELQAEGWQFHHWFPQALADRFSELLDIDVHEYTSLIPGDFHIEDLHIEGEWNVLWEDWLDEAEVMDYTADDAVEYLYELLQPYLKQMEEAGILGPNGLQAIVPYPGR